MLHRPDKICKDEKKPNNFLIGDMDKISSFSRLEESPEEWVRREPCALCDMYEQIISFCFRCSCHC